MIGRGAKLFPGKFTKGVKHSGVNEVSFKRPESRACLGALETLGVLAHLAYMPMSLDNNDS